MSMQGANAEAHLYTVKHNSLVAHQVIKYGGPARTPKGVLSLHPRKLTVYYRAEEASYEPGSHGCTLH